MKIGLLTETLMTKLPKKLTIIGLLETGYNRDQRLVTF